MKLFRLIIAVAMAVTSGIAMTAPLPASGESEATPEYDVPLALRMYTHRTQCVLGEPVQVYLLLENLSDSPLVFRTNFSLDMSVIIGITPANGSPRRFIDEESGFTIPSVVSLPPRGTRGFFVYLVHSDTPGGGLAFPSTGLYRIDAAMQVLAEGADEVWTVASLAESIRIVDPLTEAETAAHEIFMDLNVARAVQNREGTEWIIPQLEEVIERAPDTVFAEHAHFLLATVEILRGNYLVANEHLYEVYDHLDGFYAKDLVLRNILSNFHLANEPERALLVCRVLLDLYPQYRQRSDRLVGSYRHLLETENQG